VYRVVSAETDGITGDVSIGFRLGEGLGSGSNRGGVAACRAVVQADEVRVVSALAVVTLAHRGLVIALSCLPYVLTLVSHATPRNVSM
jgi:hypothetical protein